MSENEIKPVAWQVTQGRTFVDRAFMDKGQADSSAESRRDGAVVVPLYDQSAIDRLTAERDDALAAVSSKAGWEWKKRAEKAEAERDAAVADARQLRDFVDVEKNVLIAAASRARRCLAWACEQRPEFNAEYEALDAAIDAARSEGE